MKTPPALAVLFVALVAAKPAAAAPTPLVNLAGDDASCVVYIADAPTLVKRWPDTPWMKMWHDPQVQKYFAPLRAQWKLDEWDERCKTDTGYTVSQLLGFATGEGIVIVPDLTAVIEAGKNKTDPPVLLAFEVGANAAKIEKAIAGAETGDKDKKYTETTEDFAGVTLHLIGAAAKDGATPPPPDAWAVSDGVLYASTSKEFLQQTLSAAKKGGLDDALGKTDGFMRMRHRAGDAQLIAYANIKGMYPGAQKALAEKKSPQNSTAANPFVPDPTAILPALGLDAVDEFYLTANLGPAAADLGFGFTYRERRGLTKLLAYTDGAPPQPQFVPEKCFAVSSVRFSLKDLYDSLEEMLGNISPMFAGMFEGYAKNFNQRLGIDIRRDLLGCLGDQVVVASALNEAAPADAPARDRFSQFYAISVENAGTLTTAFEAVKRGLFGDAADKVFEKTDYLGHALYTYAPPQPPPADGEPPRPAPAGFSYAVTDHWLFLGVGSAAPVKSALQGLDGKQASFWDKPDVKRNLLADLPDNASGLSYIDASKVIPVYFDLIVQGMENNRRAAAMRKAAAQAEAGQDQAGGSAQPDTAAADSDQPLIDAGAKPDAATLSKYWSYIRSYSWHDSDGFYGTERIAYPK